MSAALHVSMPFVVPEVSQADIESFHATHFNDDAISLFGSQFLRPNLAQHASADYDCYEEEEEYDDGLGYYPDGVKRTLTDEQVAIFRHSELEALRRAERASKSATTNDFESAANQTGGEQNAHMPREKGRTPTNPDAMYDSGEGSEDGEIETEKPVLTKAEIRRQKRQRAKQKKRENQKFQPEKKPDLRKRTWDVVESGMDSLHYDDLGLSQGHGATSAMPRKQISYDD
ncbi:hypothetical protein F4861DRAFT_494303 [Xylaria intraflava]|nr:hypothetical protein F4861DRAFT_494303 [Xylaria intraflava]